MIKTPRLLLYKAIKSLIADSNFKIVWHDMDELSEMTCGVYIRSGRSPQIRDLSSGRYTNRRANVTFNINTNKQLDGMMLGDEYCEKIVSTLSQCINYKYTDSIGNSSEVNLVDNIWDDEDTWNDLNTWHDQVEKEIKEEQDIYILRFDLIGDVNNLGKNSQGIEVYSINFEVVYGG